MLRELSFQTIGDVARHGLELHVYCPRCFATRRLDLEVNTALHSRPIATTRFRCRRCGTPGVPKIRPAELLQVGGPVTLAFLWCPRCIWEIDQANSTSLHGPAAPSAIAALAAVDASTGTFTARHGGRALWWPQFDRESRIEHPAADMTAKLPSRP